MVVFITIAILFFVLTLILKAYIKTTDFLIKELKIHLLQGAPPVSEGSHTGALEV